jgi:adenosyl cobinamide kinase/adenosyl cobinamide phosphate guanylyltransferase
LIGFNDVWRRWDTLVDHVDRSSFYNAASKPRIVTLILGGSGTWPPSNPQSAGADAQVLADLNAVMERIATGKPLDAESSRRIRQRAERITEEIRKKHGELDIAVELIREIRDEA